MAMRGLTVFITDIRSCTSKESEQRRIEKELGNIRQKFTQSNIGGYQLKKYIWKIIYMMMLGVDIDFGHMEAVNLISQSKYSEKNVGYVACTLMLTEQNDILRLIIQSIKNDLNSKNENFQCLALTCIANVGGEEFAETLVGDVQKLLVSGASRDFVKKKAALCLLRLFRKYPEVVQTDAWAHRFIDMIDSSSIGVVLSVFSLLVGLASYEPDAYKKAVPKCINWLEILQNKDVERGYIYYSQGCPWLQVKILRFLQLFPLPEAPTDYAKLLCLLSNLILNGCKEPFGAKPSPKTVNKSNAVHAILFETFNLIMHYNLSGSHDLLSKSITFLGNAISVADTNLRSLSLETMSRLSKIPGTIDAIKIHQSTIIGLLKDSDVYLKKRALDLLFNMCDKTNSADIVMELLTSLGDAEYAIREEMVLKVAILAENFAMDDRWYIDVILKLVQLAGDFVSNDIWYRVIQVVTNNDNLQAYAAQAVYDALSKPNSHETLVKLGGYILGEFGHLIEDHASSKSQFAVLYARFGSSSYPSQALLLSTFMKMFNLYPYLKPTIAKVIAPLRSFIDDELQQRAVEYNEMLQSPDQELMSVVWEIMPAFPERASSLIQMMRSVDDNDPTKMKKTIDHDEDEEEEEEEEEEESEGASDVEQIPTVSSTRKDNISDDESEESDTTESESDSSRSASPQKVDDLLAAQEFFGTNAVSASTFPPQDTSRLRQIILTNKGVVYECSVLQIGTMIQVEGTSHAKMLLYFGNKDTMRSITDISLQPALIKGVRVQMRPDSGFSVGAKAQEPMYILWQVAHPFPALAQATLQFTFNNASHRLSLSLPVAINQFSSPTPMPVPAFMDLWAKHSDNEHRFLVQSYDNSTFSFGVVAQQISDCLKYYVIPDADRSGQSVVGASAFSHLVPSGQTIRSPMLIRVELKDSAMRVACRAQHQSLSAAIESMFRAVF